MDNLPKDIIAIIQRYVFDYVYRELKKEYQYRWLNPQNIYWGDYFMRFVKKLPDYSWRYIANWRELGYNHHNDRYRELGIRRFYSEEYYPTKIIDLPAKYLHPG